jgi:hypothetical protein
MPDTSTDAAGDAIVSKVRHEIAAATEQVLARLDGIERSIGTLHKQVSNVIETLEQRQG